MDPLPPPPIATAIPDALLRTVYASDQAMYPVALSYDRLYSWANACPELCVCFRYPPAPREVLLSPENDDHVNDGDGTDGDGIVGVIIVLPLRRQYWERLLDGRLKEPDVEPGEMFPGSSLGGDGQENGMGRVVEEEVGLHVYHIEKFGAFNESMKGQRFSEFALAEVAARARLKPGWNVIGISALTATQDGKRTFERLGFSPTGYRELFVAKYPGQSPRESGSDTQQLRMVCLSPGQGTHLDQAIDGGAIVTMSEMTLRYEL
ncbi:uncharacterized protein C8A04DRAFT_15876 [Dichotomopilus funicola]|uniref:Uncharacterized protein n=1 Tax=Dichotomopilus funicola TaxID=1934379 RepID=A0AAN6UUX1_9PEZI|nr:hypothetical protein C8A04DRAFT_15876 [Dichotomopilus funicola]